MSVVEASYVGACDVVLEVGTTRELSDVSTTGAAGRTLSEELAAGIEVATSLVVG